MNDYSTVHSISKSKVDCSDAVNSDGSSKSGDASGGDGSGSGTVDGFKRRRRRLLTLNVIQKKERKKENEQNVIVVGEKKEEKNKMEKKKKNKGRVVVGAESLVASKYAILKKYTKIGIIADPTTVLPLTLTHLIDQMVLIGKQNIKHQKKTKKKTKKQKH